MKWCIFLMKFLEKPKKDEAFQGLTRNLRQLAKG